MGKGVVSITGLPALGRPWRHLIAIVGDSWANRGKMDDGIRFRCFEAGVPVLVKSDGMPGGTTDVILTKFTSRVGMLRFLESNYHDLQKVVIITAGINDAVGHRGSEFYCSNVSKMAALAVDRGIRTFVIEIPDFDIGAIENELAKSLGGMKRALFRWYNDHGQTDIIDRYREALRKRLPASVSLINIDQFANRRTPERFIDHIHLHPELFDSLGELVADNVLSSMAPRSAPIRSVS